MKAFFNKAFWIIATIILAGVIYITPIQASSGIASIKPGKTVKITKGKVYKFTVPREGIVEFEFNKENYINLDKTTKNGFVNNGIAMLDFPNYPTEWKMLKKGTYYIYAFDSGRFKINIIGKPKNKPNYTMKKAISLPKNKKVSVLQMGKNKYDRWYKIHLKKNQTVSFTTNYTLYIRMCDSQGKNIELTNSESGSSYHVKRYSKNRLKKGTYYFVISYNDENYEDDDYQYRTLKWK